MAETCLKKIKTILIYCMCATLSRFPFTYYSYMCSPYSHLSIIYARIRYQNQIHFLSNLIIYEVEKFFCRKYKYYLFILFHLDSFLFFLKNDSMISIALKGVAKDFLAFNKKKIIIIKKNKNYIFFRVQTCVYFMPFLACVYKFTLCQKDTHIMHPQ